MEYAVGNGAHGGAAAPLGLTLVDRYYHACVEDTERLLEGVHSAVPPPGPPHHDPLIGVIELLACGAVPPLQHVTPGSSRRRALGVLVFAGRVTAAARALARAAVGVKLDTSELGARGGKVHPVRHPSRDCGVVQARINTAYVFQVACFRSVLAFPDGTALALVSEGGRSAPSLRQPDTVEILDSHGRHVDWLGFRAERGLWGDVIGVRNGLCRADFVV